MVYVVERYLPGLSRSDLLRGLSKLEPAIEELRSEGPPVRYLGSTIVLGDEACFCQFEGPSEAAVAEANRRASLSFDRIVPAIAVQRDEGRNPMTVQTTIPRPIRLRRRWPFVVGAAVLAAGITAALLAVSLGSGGNTAAPSSTDMQYAKAIAALSPAQLKAAFGTEGVTLLLTPKERRYVAAIASMSPAQLEAAFGTGDAVDALGLSPKDERYVRAIGSMTPAQLSAAFGTGR